jgi:clan AA aspartic protease (TIGR02281 family)
MELGERKEFISSCVKGYKSAVDRNGVSIDAKQYCSCVCDNLLPKLHSSDILASIENDDIAGLLTKDENLEIIMECLEGNSGITKDFKYEDGDSRNKELEKQIAVRVCVKGIQEDKELSSQVSPFGAQKYCSCVIDNIYEMGLTYEQVEQIDQENSEAFNKAVLPCAEFLLMAGDSDSSGTLTDSDVLLSPDSDIIGPDTSSVVLMDYFNKGYKLLLTIGGVERYFLFDTGASDLIIDRETERELLLNGAIKKDDYRGTTKYALANKDEVKAQIIILDNVKIGDFVVNNVRAAVIEDGSLLCGKSLIDKFSKYEINTRKRCQPGNTGSGFTSFLVYPAFSTSLSKLSCWSLLPWVIKIILSGLSPSSNTCGMITYSPPSVLHFITLKVLPLTMGSNGVTITVLPTAGPEVAMVFAHEPSPL